MRFKGFNVTVNTPTVSAHGSTNFPLPEYPTKDFIHENKTSTYVESQVGKQFTISCENETMHDASVIFYVDGQMASVLLCYAKPKYNIVNCLGVQPQPGLLQRFVFSKATLSEKEGGRGDEVGTIKVVVRRCLVMGYNAPATYMQFDSQSAIQEKTQKGLLDTKTELQAAEVYKHGPCANVIYIDNGKPWAEFTFIYKSQDLLQALGVAPRISSDVDNAQTIQQDDNTTEEDLRNAKRRRLELRRRQRQPTEPLQSSSLPHSDNPLRTRKLTIKKEVELIDLTEE